MVFGMPRKLVNFSYPQFKMHVIENFYIATLSIPGPLELLAQSSDDVVQLLLEEPTFKPFFANAPFQIRDQQNARDDFSTLIISPQVLVKKAKTAQEIGNNQLFINNWSNL